MLLKKIVLGRREMTPEVTIENAIREIGRICGEKFWEANVKVRNEDSSYKFCNFNSEGMDESLKIKNRKWSRKIIEEVKNLGRQISFSDDEIANEEDIAVDVDIEDISKRYREDKNSLSESDLLSYYFITEAANAWHKEEKLDDPKCKEDKPNSFDTFIRNTFRRAGVSSVSFKIIKYGSKKYSLFIIN